MSRRLSVIGYLPMESPEALRIGGLLSVRLRESSLGNTPLATLIGRLRSTSTYFHEYKPGIWWALMNANCSFPRSSTTQNGTGYVLIGKDFWLILRYLSASMQMSITAYDESLHPLDSKLTRLQNSSERLKLLDLRTTGL